MTGKEMLKAMGHIDEELVEDAKQEIFEQPAKKKSFNWVAVMIAALVCVVGGTAVAASDFGIKFLETFVSPEESGYKLEAEVEKFPMHVFDGEVVEVEEIIKKQFQEYEPYMSWYPGSYYKEFSSSKEVINYLGFDKIKILEWNYEETKVALYITGNKTGRIEHILIERFFEDNEIRMQEWTTILTKESDDEEKLIVSSATTEYLTHASTIYTNENGKECQIVTSSVRDSGYTNKEGFVVADGVLYQLNIIYREGAEEKATEILKEWLNRY